MTIPCPAATLREAANLIQKLPKAQQRLPHWQAAIQALIMAAEERGPLLHARVGMSRALNHGKERVYSDRKETHWSKRKLKRDVRTLAKIGIQICIPRSRCERYRIRKSRSIC